MFPLKWKIGDVYLPLSDRSIYIPISLIYISLLLSHYVCILVCLVFIHSNEKMWVKALVTTDFCHDLVFTTMHYPYFDYFLGCPMTWPTAMSHNSQHPCRTRWTVLYPPYWCSTISWSSLADVGPLSLERLDWYLKRSKLSRDPEKSETKATNPPETHRNALRHYIKIAKDFLRHSYSGHTRGCWWRSLQLCPCPVPSQPGAWPWRRNGAAAMAAGTSIRTGWPWSQVNPWTTGSAPSTDQVQWDHIRKLECTVSMRKTRKS
jgi:hypothetical protein